MHALPIQVARRWTRWVEETDESGTDSPTTCLNRSLASFSNYYSSSSFYFLLHLSYFFFPFPPFSSFFLSLAISLVVYLRSSISRWKNSPRAVSSCFRMETVGESAPFNISSSAEDLFYIITNSVEMIFHIVGLCIASMFVYVMCKSSVLHINLLWILGSLTLALCLTTSTKCSFLNLFNKLHSFLVALLFSILTLT